MRTARFAALLGAPVCSAPPPPSPRQDGLRSGVDPAERRPVRRPSRLPGHRVPGAGRRNVDQGPWSSPTASGRQQIEGPEWIGPLRFDWPPPFPTGVPGSKIPEMLRTLLADRFQLKVHRESKELPVYVLGVSKSGPGSRSRKGSQRARRACQHGEREGRRQRFGRRRQHWRRPLVQHRRQPDADSRDDDARHGRNADALRRSPRGGSDRADEDLRPHAGSHARRIQRHPRPLRRERGVPLPPQAMRLLDNVSPDTMSGPLSKFGLTFEARKRAARRAGRRIGVEDADGELTMKGGLKPALYVRPTLVGRI